MYFPLPKSEALRSAQKVFYQLFLPIVLPDPIENKQKAAIINIIWKILKAIREETAPIHIGNNEYDCLWKSMTFIKSMMAKIKYLVRTVICEPGDVLHLFNINPDVTDWYINGIEFVWQFCHALGFRKQCWTEKRWKLCNRIGPWVLKTEVYNWDRRR